MAEAVLVGAAAEAGAKLMAELDRTQFPVECMFWVQLTDSSRWRLVIGSPRVREEGPRAVYERLESLLRGADIGLSLMNISVFDPESSELSSLLSVVETSGRLVAGPSWLTFGEGVVYRWTGDKITGELSRELTHDDLVEAWEVERRLTNQPKLLFTQLGKRVTIRFHPQHGRLAGLANVRQAYRIALDRRYPNCEIEITWTTNSNGVG